MAILRAIKKKQNKRKKRKVELKLGEVKGKKRIPPLPPSKKIESIKISVEKRRLVIIIIVVFTR